MHFTTSLIAVSAAVAVSASPIDSRTDAEAISVPVTYRTNVKSIKNIVEKGRAKFSKDVDSVSSGQVTNDDVSYVADVLVGGKSQTLIVDTGSSNTWCGADFTSCEPTSSGKSLGEVSEISYGSGEFVGTEYEDKVSFGGKTVKKQQLGSAILTKGFSGVDGIIGFGPVDLTEDTVIGETTVPTFMNNLYSEGKIPTEELGVSFRPETGSDTSDTNGVLTLGGVDSSRYTGTLQYFPRTTTGDTADYWGIAIDEFSYGSTNLGSADGIVDTGTTLIYVPKTTYSGFLAAAGGTTNEDSGLAQFTKKPTEDFNVGIGDATFPLTPSQYLVPEAQYSYFSLDEGYYYAWIASGGDSGVDCIIGQKFIEQYYVAFDTTTSQIGFAAGTS